MGTRERLLENGAALFAAKGFHGVGVEELGESVGLTGPRCIGTFAQKRPARRNAHHCEQLLLEGATEVMRRISIRSRPSPR